VPQKIKYHRPAQLGLPTNWPQHMRDRWNYYQDDPEWWELARVELHRRPWCGPCLASGRQIQAVHLRHIDTTWPIDPERLFEPTACHVLCQPCYRRIEAERIKANLGSLGNIGKGGVF
jgi:hypothetical protein